MQLQSNLEQEAADPYKNLYFGNYVGSITKMS